MSRRVERRPEEGETMAPPPAVTGRDFELITIGVACFLAAGWFGLLDRPLQWRPLLLFLAIGGLSFGLAGWDIRTRGGPSWEREEGR